MTKTDPGGTPPHGLTFTGHLITEADMVSDTKPMQADGGGAKGGDATGAGKSGGGESAGGAYPNPHRGKTPKDGEAPSDATGHGGQTEIAYHGPGQLGEQAVGGKKDAGRTGQGG